MTALHSGEEPAEHRPFARYLQALEAVVGVHVNVPTRVRMNVPSS
ncbi:hypothetical protein ABZS68_19205 [Streptomyces sp. NPDC005571]